MQSKYQFDFSRLNAIRHADLRHFSGDLRWLQAIPVLLGHVMQKNVVGITPDERGGWRLHAYAEEPDADTDGTCGNRHFSVLAGDTLDAALETVNRAALALYAVRDTTLAADIMRHVFYMEECPQTAYAMPAELRALRRAEG